MANQVNKTTAVATPVNEVAKVPTVLNAEVKTFKQTITDEETGVVVKNLYYLRIVRGNVTVQINVGEKTFNQIKTLTEAPAQGDGKNEKKI